MILFRLFKIRRPINILILINILFFGLLYLYVKPLDPLILIAGGVLNLLMVISYVIIVKRKMGDEYIFLIISMLTSISVIMLYRLNPSYGFRQIFLYGLGIIMYFMSYIIFRFIKNWKEYMFFYIICSMLLFLATFIFGVNIKGATNWIHIGESFSFQPAEIIKIFFVFFIAAYYSNKEKLKNTYVFLGIVYLHIFMLLLQRELGISLLFYIVFISIFYIYEEDQRLLIYNLGIALVIGVTSYFTMSHVKVRLTTWINPWQDIAGKGYQITQSLFAISAGGFFGTGLGLGSPDYIPEVHTDFIFSAICEEMGTFGGMAVVLLYFILIYRGFKISLTVEDPFKKIVALGITLIYSYQTFIIVGGVIKLIPLTGVTLPFISYGGSSLISAFIAFGIIQAISKKTLEREEAIEIGKP